MYLQRKPTQVKGEPDSGRRFEDTIEEDLFTLLLHLTWCLDYFLNCCYTSISKQEENSNTRMSRWEENWRQHFNWEKLHQDLRAVKVFSRVWRELLQDQNWNSSLHKTNARQCFASLMLAWKSRKTFIFQLIVRCTACLTVYLETKNLTGEEPWRRPTPPSSRCPAWPPTCPPPTPRTSSTPPTTPWLEGNNPNFYLMKCVGVRPAAGL